MKPAIRFLLSLSLLIPLAAPSAPANDTCAGAQSLAAGAPVSMSTTDATSTGDPTLDCGRSPGNGVWFRFTPSISGAVTISTCGASYDTVIGVFTGGCGGLTPIPGGCVDDSSECGSQSVITFPGAAGAAYWILVAGTTSATGNLTIRADVAPIRITVQPSDYTLEAGDTYTFSVEAVGNPPLTYQWRQNGSIVPGGNNYLIRANAGPSMAGDYVVVISSGASSVTSSVARLTVTRGLEAALDMPGLAWATGGGAEGGWYRQTDISRDGSDCARCGVAGGAQPPWMETVVYGAATVKFWWRFQRPAGATDYIRLTVNGQEQAQLYSTTSDWFEHTAYVGSGSQTCRWTYVEGALPGGNAALVDQVVLYYGGTAAQIAGHPESQTVLAGAPAILDVTPIGTPPFSYQWFYKGSPLTGATQKTLSFFAVQPRDAGSYYVRVQNTLGPAVNSIAATLWVTPLPLGEAVDYRGLPFVNGPSSGWFGQVGVSMDGDDAAQTEEITHNQQSAVQFQAEGPATISFWWKVSSETNYDALQFQMDSVVKTQIWGEVNWKQQSFNIPAGKHMLAWVYSKDLSVSRGQDAGWLDQVVYTGKPFLSIWPAGSNAVQLSWPASLQGYVLQSAPAIPGTVWTNVPSTPAILGDDWVVTDGAGGARKFYRLLK